MQGGELRHTDGSNEGTVVLNPSSQVTPPQDGGVGIPIKATAEVAWLVHIIEAAAKEQTAGRDMVTFD